MNHWETVELKDWPSDVTFQIPVDSFSPEVVPKIARSQRGDWVIIFKRSQIESLGSSVFGNLLEQESSFHRVGIVHLAAKPKKLPAAMLESLFKYCDLIAYPTAFQYEGERVDHHGELSLFSQTEDKNSTPTKASFHLLKPRPISAELLGQGVPLKKTDEEDLDAREKWFRGRQ